MNKQEVLSQVLSLNSDDKDYVITVEDNKIITQVKWMDATFFSPMQITDEIRNFKYIVELHDKQMYSEVDESFSSSFTVSGTGLNKKISFFKGKSLTYDKTIGLGRDNNTGDVGVIENTFYSEDYKKPVRDFLQQCGYKKKMSGFTKAMIITSVSIVAFIALILAIVLCFFDINKEAITAEEFSRISEECQLLVTDASDDPSIDREAVDEILVSENDDLYLQYWNLSSTELAENFFDGNVQAYTSEYSASAFNVSGINYEKTELTGSDNQFVIISRIDDTVIFAETTKENEDSLKEIIDELTY